MVTKLTLPSKENAVQEKVNEIIDNLGGGYSAGTGIDISNNTISVDNTVAMKTDIPTVNNATLTITQGGTTKGTFTANASSNVTIDLDSGGGSSRNIGEIVQSTIPLTDAGLHLLDGALISGSGSYADFVTCIAGLVSSYPDVFTTEANWQTAVTTYGVCGKFVYDSVNNTVRLPNYSNKFWSGGGIANAKGNDIALGLKGSDGVNYGACASNVGIFAGASSQYGVAPYTGSKTGYNPTAIGFGITTDSAKSGIIADLSTITTALDGYWYIVIATSTKTDIQVDIDEIANDLNGKADTDLSNINASQSAKNTIVGWGIPDYSSGIVLSSSSFPYTAPSNGLLYQAASNCQMYVNGNEAIYNGSAGGASSVIAKDDIVTIGEGSFARCYFYPLKGVDNA